MSKKTAVRETPGPGQESVWDYPRPPALEHCSKTLRIVVDDTIIAETTAAYRVLETSHPPVYYFPPQSVRAKLLEPERGQSFCEWKGVAQYWTLRLGNRVLPNVAWSYPNPTSRFAAIKGYFAFYPAAMDACTVDGDVVKPQPGGFYGGWITPDVVGPFKGEPGTEFW